MRGAEAAAGIRAGLGQGPRREPAASIGVVADRARGGCARSCTHIASHARRSRATRRSATTRSTRWLAARPSRPGSAAGPARARTKDLSVDIEPVPEGTRLVVTAPRLRLEVLAERPPGHEAMGVVVPWSPRLFQYTVKDVARPAVGRLWVDGVEHPVPAGGSWAVLDHGRGRWPYSMHWNWGAGSGMVDGHVVGVQVGGRWTFGTGLDRERPGRRRAGAQGERGAAPGSTTRADWLAPWRVHGRARRPHLHAVLGPRLLDQPRRARPAGRPVLRPLDRLDESTTTGERVRVDGILGWAEDVQNRW